MTERYTCAHCSTTKDDIDMFTCSKCKQSHYCGAECQKADWSKHRVDCLHDFMMFEFFSPLVRGPLRGLRKSMMLCAVEERDGDGNGTGELCMVHMISCKDAADDIHTWPSWPFSPAVRFCKSALVSNDKDNGNDALETVKIVHVISAIFADGGFVSATVTTTLGKKSYEEALSAEQKSRETIDAGLAKREKQNNH